MNLNTFPLAGLHRLAAERGDGLHPVLVRHFEAEAERAAAGVVRFDPVPVRVAPVRQIASEEALSEAGVTVLSAAGSATAVAPQKAKSGR